jgi:hypothetical protein
MANLDAYLTTPTSSTMPSGSSSWSSFGGDPSSGGFSGSDLAGWGKIAAPFVTAAFGPGNPYKGDVENIGKQALTFGAADKAAGTNALAPVLKYLTALVSGDPSSVMEATAPQRARIIDQYDTARKALAQQPRGGGQASAALKLEQGKASDLATTTSAARSEGVKSLAAVGTNLVQTGAYEQETGLQAALRAFQGLSQQKDASNADFGKAIGMALPFILAAL